MWAVNISSNQLIAVNPAMAASPLISGVSWFDPAIAYACFDGHGHDDSGVAFYSSSQRESYRRLFLQLKTHL